MENKWDLSVEEEKEQSRFGREENEREEEEKAWGFCSLGEEVVNGVFSSLTGASL